MWGSLARGITETVKETASAAASTAVAAAPHAGDVLRRVGEVVAPPLGNGDEYYDDDEEYEEDDDGSYYYEEGEEDGNGGGDDGLEFDEDEGVDLDRYRKKAGVAANVDQQNDIPTTNNNSTVIDEDTNTAPTSINSLVNDEPHNFSEDKSIQDKIEKQQQQQQILLQQQQQEEKEAEEARLHAEQVEHERLAAIAKEEAEEKERQRLAAEEKKEADRLAELKRIEHEKQLAEEEEKQREEHRLAAEAARRAEFEKMERERILEEERILKERQQADIAAAEAAEKKRIEDERAAAEEAAREKAEEERIKQEQLAAKAEAERQVELERLELESIENVSIIEEQRLQQEKIENERLERERLEAEAEAAKAAKLERLELERIEKERLAAEQRQREEADRLAAEETAEIERLELERIEQEQLMEEKMKQMQQEEMALEAEHKRRMEAMEQERLERVERERSAGEEQIRVLHQQEDERAANEAQLMEELQIQKSMLDKVNNEAQESASQLANVQRERNGLQTSNEELQTTCEQLKGDLHRAAEDISKLKLSVAEQEEKERLRWEQEARRVEEEESSILTTAKTDMESQIAHVRESLQAQINTLEQELAEERKLSVDQQHELQQRLEEATDRLTMSESDMKAQISKKEAKTSKQLQAAEKAAAKAVGLLDKKDEEVQQLQQVIADLRETMKKNKLDEEEAEEEMDELHHENEELHAQVEKLQKENDEIKEKLTKTADDSEKLGGLKMELQMLEEERSREKAKLESAVEGTKENHAQVISERNESKAHSRDLEQLLAAAQADLELANTDRDRALLANENLQRALEDFQSERDAELALLTEQHKSAEEAIAAAHAASLDAMKQKNEQDMRDIQYATDRSIQNQLTEMDKMEATIIELRKESMNLRKALDEAIARLQTNQEDVIDRSLIKNIILDWHAKKGKAKRDVMILLGSILHFTEDEKDKAYISEGQGTLDRVYGAVVVPLPHSKLDADKIEGDTVREKWVNFLLAETGEEEAEPAAAEETS